MEKTEKQANYGLRDSFVLWVSRNFLRIQPVWGVLLGLAAAKVSGWAWIFYFGAFLDISAFIWQKGVIMGYEEGAKTGKEKKEENQDRPLSPTEAMVILGLQPGFGADDLRRAYREKTKLFHPDAGGGHEQFLLLRRALETLEKELTKNGNNGQ